MNDRSASSLTSGEKAVIGVGLNLRLSNGTASSTVAPSKSIAPKKTNVFDEHDDDDEDAGDNPLDHNNLSGRGTVNRELAAEQAALRKRAAIAAAVAVGDSAAVYDYDGAYDSFESSSKSKLTAVSQQQQPNDNDEQRKSRYIGDLLKAAEHRKRQRDIAYERKLAKEQEAELLALVATEGGGDAANVASLQNPERFITKSYKRKLQERQLWQQEEDARAREEEANDVTKTKKGEAMVNFYGNLARSHHEKVVVGGAEQQQPKDTHELENQKEHEASDDNSTRKSNGNSALEPITKEDVGSAGAGAYLTFLEGFEPASGNATDDSTVPPSTQRQESRRDDDDDDAKQGSSAITTTATTPAERRRLREEKVAQARIRYFRRKGMILEAEAEEQMLLQSKQS